MNHLHGNIRFVCIAFLLSGITGSKADTLRLTSETTITAADLAYEGKDVVIDHCIVTIDGKHQFNTLQLINQAVLTHPACTTSNLYAVELEITQSLSIDASSKIDATSRGYLPGRTGGNSNVGGATGPSGGSYGGTGGYGNSGEPNRVYGDYRNPAEPGAGSGVYYPGGPGGGLIRITAETVVLDGVIVAKGADGTDGWHYGGGSGGAILLNVGTLSGRGSIAADGGIGYTIGGAGGGGRVAVYYRTRSSQWTGSAT